MIAGSLGQLWALALFVIALVAVVMGVYAVRKIK